MSISNVLKFSCVFIFCLYLINNAATATGDIKDITDIKIVDYGITKSTGLESQKYDKAVAGKVFAVKKDSIVSQTDTIPLKIGVEFGLRYELISKNKTALKYPITCEVIYPRNMTNPQNGRSERAWSFKTFDSGNVPCFSGFEFSDNFELLEGKWMFKVTVGDKSIQKTFYCVKK
ncbi:MAG: DUF3859 domain-containing protein [Chitinivibrionales bacterium]|nr:DUF3859 domain-containing protein [Chitinivibrionales bacterium]